MPELKYPQLESYVDDLSREAFLPVYLIHGEEFLYKKILDHLVQKLLLGEDPTTACEIMDGEGANAAEAIERVNTYTLLAGKKIVILADAKVFYEKNTSDALLDKAGKAASDRNMKKAARIFMDYLAINGYKPEDVPGSALEKKLTGNNDNPEKAHWVKGVMDYCLENNLSPSAGSSASELILNAIEKGFPTDNHLIITTEHVDKRRQLYKIIKEKGAIFDCAVPKGERKADKDAQNAVMNGQLKTLLATAGKTMAPNAISVLHEMTGFDLRTFYGNIEKLIDYAGDRKQITAHDVRTLLTRTKSDPIFEITNAVADRNGEKALYFTRSLVAGGMHPLQLLAAVVNQIRRLTACRAFIEKGLQNRFNSKMTFAEFKTRILPLIVDFDQALLHRTAQWEAALSPPQSPGKEAKKKKNKKKPKPSTDLLIAKNPGNAYPIYQQVTKSARFSIQELKNALQTLHDADRLMKSSAQDPVMVLEKALVTICSLTNKT